MADKKLHEHIAALISYMDDNVPVDGMYKVTVLKTVAEYYSTLTQAESMEVAIRNIFRPN
jgi:hypothetical protein